MSNKSEQTHFHVHHGQFKSNEERFEELYRESYHIVYNYVYYRLLDRQAAEDVTSEAFMRAAGAFDRFDPSRAKFSTWVVTIARNCTISYLRANKPVVLLGDDLAPIDVNPKEDEYPSLNDDAATCQRLLATLDEEDRELVYLKYYRGMRNSEIALELDMNASTVATRLQRALAKMHTVAERSEEAVRAERSKRSEQVVRLERPRQTGQSGQAE